MQGVSIDLGFAMENIRGGWSDSKKYFLISGKQVSVFSKHMVFRKASQQCVFSFLYAVMTCLLLIVNSKTRSLKIKLVFTNTTRRKISEINCFKTVFNCIKHSKNVVFLCQAIPGRFQKSLKMVFYPGQIKTQKSQKEHILVSRKSLIFRVIVSHVTPGFSRSMPNSCVAMLASQILRLSGSGSPRNMVLSNAV